MQFAPTNRHNKQDLTVFKVNFKFNKNWALVQKVCYKENRSW
ncbi:hypothetical protein [Moraxella lacunata]